MNNIEPILQENKDRFVMFPIKHKEMWDLYKKIEQRFWTPETEFKKDEIDFLNNLNDKERKFLSMAMSALVLKYRVFGDKSLRRFLSEVQYPESRCFIGFAEMMGNIYYEVMSIISVKFCDINSSPEKNINDLMKLDSVKEIINWIDINFLDNNSFSGRLVAYSCLKRIMFSGLMAVITSFKLKGRIEVVVMLMTFIFEDEGLYTDFMLTTYAQLDNKENTDTAKKIINEAVKLENNFIKEFNDTFSCELINVNKLSDFTDYISSSIEESVLNNSNQSKNKNPFNFINWDRSFVLIDKNKKEYVMDRTIRFDADF